MSFFRSMFGAKSPPRRPKEPTPVSPSLHRPKPAPPAQKPRTSLFQGLEIKNETVENKPGSKSSAAPAMFSGLNINTRESDGGGGGGGGGDAFGFLDDGGGDDGGSGPSDAFGFLDGMDMSDVPAGSSEGGGSLLPETGTEGNSAFAFLGTRESTESTTKPPSVENKNKPSLPADKPEKAVETEPPTSAAPAAPSSVPGSMFTGLKVENDNEPAKSSNQPALTGGIDSFLASAPAPKPTVVPIKLSKAEAKTDPPKTTQQPQAMLSPSEKARRLEKKIEPNLPKPQSQSKEDIANARLCEVLKALCAARKRYHDDRKAIDSQAAAEVYAIQDTEAKLSQAQAAEEAAIVAEDYEAADARSKEIDHFKIQLQEMKAKSKAKADMYKKLEKEKVTSISSSLSGLQKALEGLSTLADERAAEKEGYIKSNTQRLQRMEDKATADLERIERQLGHNEVDRKHVEEEENDILKAINLETKDVSEKKEKLASEAIEIELEVEGLKAQLAKKIEELTTHRKEIEDCDAKIGEARSGYDRQLKRISEKRDGILKDRMEAESEQNEVQTQLSLLKEQLEKLKTAEEDFDGGIIKLKERAVGIKSLVDALQEETKIASSTEAEASSADETSGETSHLDEKISKVQAEIKAIESKRISKEEELLESKSEIEKIDFALPGLNAKKKAAVKRRAFKDAAKIAAEMKQLAAKKDAASKIVSSASDEIESLKTELTSKDDERASLEKQLNNALSKEDERRVELLEHLRANYKKQLSNASVLPEDVRETHITTLTLHLDAIDSEASLLRDRHGWPEDFKRVPEPEPEIKETKEDEAPIEQREDQPQVVPLENPEAKDTAAPSTRDPRREMEEKQAVLETVKARVVEYEKELEKREALIEQYVEEENFEGAAQLEEESEADRTSLMDMRARIETLEKDIAELEEEIAAIPQESEEKQPEAAEAVAETADEGLSEDGNEKPEQELETAEITDPSEEVEEEKKEAVVNQSESKDPVSMQPAETEPAEATQEPPQEDTKPAEPSEEKEAIGDTANADDEDEGEGGAFSFMNE